MYAQLGLAAAVALLTGWLFAFVSTTRLFYHMLADTRGGGPGAAAEAMVIGGVYATVAICELPGVAARAAHKRLGAARGAYAASKKGLWSMSSPQ